VDIRYNVVEVTTVDIVNVTVSDNEAELETRQ
jgi:hypothetical protein